MAGKMTLQEMESHLWKSANFLRNRIDAGDYKSYIFPMLFYKRICDVYDEEYRQALEESDGDAEYAASRINHRFQVPAKAHWNEMRKATMDVGLKITRFMRAIEKANPDTLYGIFGDANWGNRDRLSDETLVNLIEHFSRLYLSNEAVPDDLMGTAYEYLIRKFADDSGHTAAEFYTNRTVVTLMAELLDPQPGETVYDPTCGTGGMLLECVNHLKRKGREYRSTRLFGQEKNAITSTIARMNMLMHGFEDVQIRRGDTLSDPMFIKNDRLQQFDVILANPPYSVSRWDKKAFSSDPFGRNIYGTPPQGRADYAFIQHIVTSQSRTGRSAVLLPHGVLFRNEEAHIRKKLVSDDTLEAVIGLPPDMFYNSVMESCIMIFNSNKGIFRKNKIQFINAVKKFERIGNKNFLGMAHIEKIADAFTNYKSIEGFSRIVDVSEIAANNYWLNIPKYVAPIITAGTPPLKTLVKEWQQSSNHLKNSLTKLKVVSKS